MNDLQRILAPNLPPTLFHREQLLRDLGEALGAHGSTSYHLVLLCAPAGYGKTTLLADTVQAFSLVCCWYFLDHCDQDLTTFLATLCASIRQRFPDVGSRLAALSTAGIEQNDEALKQYLNRLGSILADIPEHWVIALCNYQKVNHCSEINHLIDLLWKHLPAQCLLVIESRALPALELAVLVAKQQIFGLGSHNLRFSAQEVYTFARAKGVPDFSDTEAEQVASVFDGWVAGMLLGSRLGSAQLPQFLLSQRQLLAFVVSEVFHEAEEIYIFLKETSLLDRLLPAFCDQLLNTSNAAHLLEYAENQGLFVVCVHEAGEIVYRCHPLLRQLFQEELRSSMPERYRILQQRIALLFYQTQLYEPALRHALEAQDYTIMVQILLEGVQKLLDLGQSDLVLRCLDHLPEYAMRQNPHLPLIRVNVYLRRGDFANAQCSFEKAKYQVEVAGSVEYELAYAELAIAQGELFLQRGDYQSAMEQLQFAQTRLPADERVLLIRTHQQLGICLILSGQPIYDGIAQFRQALGLCHPRLDEYLAGELHHQLANAYSWAGNYVVAEHHRQHIRMLQERLEQPYFLVNNLISMGLLKMRQGHGEEAETFFLAMLELAKQSPRLTSSKAYALLGLGELAWTRQNFREALVHLDEAFLLAHQLEDRYLLNNILNIQTLVYLRLNDIRTAQYLQGQISLQPHETRSYESVFSTLIQGTLQLAQGCYDEAKCLLNGVVDLTGKTGMQWLQVQALMRLAACHLAQNDRRQAKEAAQQALTLNARGDHDHTLQVEVQAYPALRALLKEKDGQNEAIAVQRSRTERLLISALGEPTVFIDSVPVTRWRMARAMELFFFLLESHKPLRKDQIIDALWPEPEDIERINQTFRSTLYYLRQVIGETSLMQQSGLYRLNLHATYGSFQYDVAIFEEQQHIARSALEENDDESAGQAFQRTVDLYRGDYVQAFYSDWCIPRRDKLRTSFMESHRELAMIAWRGGDWDKSLLHWQHLLALDPCSEKAHYGAMQCYQRQGKRELALRQYQRCCRELQEQLGIKPGFSLQKLHQHLAHL